MPSEGSKLKAGGERLAAKQLELCSAELRAMAAKRAELNGRLQILDAQDRLVQARQRFWEIEAELLAAKRSCDQLEKEDRRYGKKLRSQADTGAAGQRVRRVEAELARALQEERDALDSTEGLGARVAALEADLRAAESLAEVKRFELQEFAREHCRAAAQLLPPEMLREVMCLLSPMDRVTAAQVCSAWREAVKTDESMWKDTKVTWRGGCKPGSKEAHSCRVLAVAPYVDELCVHKRPGDLCKLREDIKIRKVRLPRGHGSEITLKSIAGQWLIAGLDLLLTNLDTARVIDSKCSALKELSVEYWSNKTFIFSKGFVQKSTLTALRCFFTPIPTLMSIIDGHCNTLENVTVAGYHFHSFNRGDTIPLTTCIRLKCLKMDCRFAFSLPPSCEEVQLLLWRHDERCATRCEGCISLSGCGSLARLRIVTDDVTFEDVELHLRALTRKWLAGLQGVSIHSKQALTEAQRETLTGIAGRSLDFRGGGQPLANRWMLWNHC